MAFILQLPVAAVCPKAGMSYPLLPLSFSSLKLRKRVGEGARSAKCCSVSGVEEGGTVMPNHVAIIIDGHRKWAESRGVTVQDGHQTGINNWKYIISRASKLGIKVLTIWAWSPQNFNRSKNEIDFIMTAFENFIRCDVKQLITRDSIRFCAIGDKSRLPESFQDAISSAEGLSQANNGMHFILAVAYGGRDDIVAATRKIATKVDRGILRPDDIDEATFEQHLMTNITQFPSPDLLIRAGGELRLSNFFLWQLPFTEFYFTDILFPDFGEADLLDALASFRRMSRGFGERKGIRQMYETHLLYILKYKERAEPEKSPTEEEEAHENGGLENP